MKYIAHAGGSYKKLNYPNTIEAFEYNYHKNGHRYFEFDLAKTTDAKDVLIHDWDKTLKKYFSLNKQPSYAEFMQAKLPHNMQPTDLDMLLKWANSKTDAVLVSDVKDQDNASLVKFVKKHYPKLLPRIIIQIFNFAQYEQIQKLGVQNIILTLYQIPQITDEEIIQFCVDKNLLGIAMPIARGKGKLPRKLANKGVAAYVHTVNTRSLEGELVKNGVRGIFTDHLKSKTK
jgi:glycerophosphoryl diester phosphodiesterase